MGQDPRPRAAPDAVARLAADLKAGAPALRVADDGRGRLSDLLRRLKVPEESQVLVFSKTSLQSSFIERNSPRAIYFNDSVAVGFVPGAPLLEIAAVGADGLTRFYSVPVSAAPGAAPAEESGCTACHLILESPVPIMLVGSITPLANGRSGDLAESRVTDARSPLDHRWGGWYVTGRHGAMKHRGNVFAADSARPRLDPDAGQNLTDLSAFFDTARYLRPTSDMVALMTLEHQVGFTALASKINAQRRAEAYAEDVEATVMELADYMVGVDEASWSSPVEGVGGFTSAFPKQGPRDPQGRSLRDFDLGERLFRYPLSYMIYSPAFDSLDPEMKTLLYRRLAQILSGAETAPKYARFAHGQGRAALEIVAATKPGLPDFWPRMGASPA